MPPARPTSDKPVAVNFASEKLTIGAGVAIFHLASERVVVCWHSRDRYWFLPKGRRNAGEETGDAAVREGFEESGYRNRLLPLPIPHRQPYPDDEPEPINPFDIEPLWTQLVPQSRTAQYILFWYAAETLPEDVENTLNGLESGVEESSVDYAGSDNPGPAVDVSRNQPVSNDDAGEAFRGSSGAASNGDATTALQVQNASLDAGEGSRRPLEAASHEAATTALQVQDAGAEAEEGDRRPIEIASHEAATIAPQDRFAESIVNQSVEGSGVVSTDVNKQRVMSDGAKTENGLDGRSTGDPGSASLSQRRTATTEDFSHTDEVTSKALEPEDANVMIKGHNATPAGIRKGGSTSSAQGNRTLSLPAPRDRTSNAPGSVISTRHHDAAATEYVTATATGISVVNKYVAPPKYPKGLTIKQRIEQDLKMSKDGKMTVYEPLKHEGTGVDEEEALYESYLLPIEEARRKLRGSIQEDVVRRGWEAVKLRQQLEG